MKTSTHILLLALLLTGTVGGEIRAEETFEVVTHVFTDANAPLAVGNARVQATVAIRAVRPDRRTAVRGR